MSEKKTSGIKNFFEEFKAFAMRGNVLDMAVGVVVGSAFTAIVNSLVNDIISPIIGLFFNADFSDVVIQIGDVGIGVGAFLNAIINFLLIGDARCVSRSLEKLKHRRSLHVAQRQRNTDPRAVHAGNRERAAERGHAFAHAGEAKALLIRPRRQAAAVIFHHQHQPFILLPAL